MKPELDLPAGWKWRDWIRRWDRMQERYIADREERFALMIRLIREARPNPRRIVDLGCGPGSLTVRLLRAFLSTEVIGIDLDPTLLALARRQLARFGPRARIIEADLRSDAWAAECRRPADAIVSATALHWLDAPSLRRLYGELGRQLRPGGIFLNADHVRIDSVTLQRNRDQQRQRVLRQYRGPGELWREFIDAYLVELGGNARAIRDAALGCWTGIEPGLPLPWHFDQLRRAGFDAVDCFWRSGTDAIYGGIRR